MQRPGTHQVVETDLRIDPMYRDRTMYPATNEYRIEFGKTFKNVVGLALHDARIPLTEDDVPSSQNTFTYIMNNASTTVSIPAGPYTEQTLIEALDTALGGTITATLNSSTGNVTFASSTAFMLDVTHTTLARQLGFTQSNGFTAMATSYTPDAPVSVSAGCRYIRIVSQDVKTPGTGMHTDPGLGIVYIDRTKDVSDPIYRALPVVYFDTIREKMSGLHIRIERDDGTLYDTKYASHGLVVRVFTLNERLIQIK